MRQSKRTEKPLSFYCDEIKIWMDSEIQSEDSLINNAYFHNIFLDAVKSNFGIKIIQDNLAADAILKLLHDPSFMKVYRRPSGFDRPSQILKEIAKVFYRNEFISKRKKEKIERDYQRASFEESLENFINLEISSQVKSSQLMAIWEQIIEVDFAKFWSDIMIERKIQELPKMRELFKIYKNTIEENLGEVVKNRFQIYFEEEHENSRELRKLAQSKYFIKNENEARYIDKFLKNLQKLLVQNIERDYGFKNVRIDTYGSFKSNFSLVNSDIDITVFGQKQGFLIERKMSESLLWKVNTILKLKEAELKITNFNTIINDKIRVPVIKIELDDDIVTSLDFVANNEPGVKNSEFLNNFARNRDIKNLGLLLKMWGKKTKLIDPYRLSSYGLLLMLMYFLMDTKKIDFIKNIYERFEVKFKIKEINYQQILCEFMDYYDHKSLFYEYKKMICLVDKCTKNHTPLFKPDLVINIHDPFDDSNPGRVKDRDRDLFFNEVRGARQILKGSSKDLIRKLFT